MKKVVKFGGSSLADAKQFKKVGDIIRADELPPNFTTFFIEYILFLFFCRRPTASCNSTEHSQQLNNTLTYHFNKLKH